MAKDLSNLRELEKSGEYLKLIAEVRGLVEKDRTIFKNPIIKGWCGRRFRNLFITAACENEVALNAAESSGLFKKDERPPRQRIAERYLRGDGPTEWKIEMPEPQIGAIDRTTLLFCPGMLNGLLPVRAFADALPAVQKKTNWKMLRADLHPMRGCEANMEDLLAALETGHGLDAETNIIPEDKRVVPGDVFIISYSKGTPDVLTLLVNHPHLKDRIRCIFNWAGAPGGSYLANDIYESVKDAAIEKVEERLTGVLRLISPVVDIRKGSLRRLEEFDIKKCVYDVTTDVRSAFMDKHRDTINDLGIPIFNITASTTAMEVPYFQIQGVTQLNRYDANNDMQVTQDQALVKMPIATDLAMLHGHHWDVSYTPFPPHMRFGSPNLDHPFPRDAGALAMFQLAAELGLVD